MAAKSPNDSKELHPRIMLPEREPRKRTETTIQLETRDALNRIPRVRVARNNVGQTPMPCGECKKRLCRRCAARLARPVAYGLGVGSPDLVGIYTALRGWACAFGVETKTKTGVTSEDQRRWHWAAAARGMPTFVARSADEGVAQVEAWTAWVDGAL